MEKIKSQIDCQTRSLPKFFKKNIFNFRNLNRLLFIFTIISGIFYIAEVNDLTIKGFTLSDLKERHSKIADENKKLELKAMNLSSYNIVGEKINNLKMVAVGNIDYLNGANETVAKK